jgi:hypothetical protein
LESTYEPQRKGIRPSGDADPITEAFCERRRDHFGVKTAHIDGIAYVENPLSINTLLSELVTNVRADDKVPIVRCPKSKRKRCVIQPAEKALCGWVQARTDMYDMRDTETTGSEQSWEVGLSSLGDYYVHVAFSSNQNRLARGPDWPFDEARTRFNRQLKRMVGRVVPIE